MAQEKVADGGVAQKAEVEGGDGRSVVGVDAGRTEMVE